VTAFLVVYDRRRLSAEITPFSGDDAVAHASKARSFLEASNQDRNVEIVTLFADSLDDLRQTHSRYFINQPRIVQPI
jgi:hypothetical protein